MTPAETGIKIDGSSSNVAEACAERGEAYFWQRDYDNAIADCTQAVELNPNGAEAYICRGKAYHRKGDHARAAEDFSRTIELEEEAV